MEVPNTPDADKRRMQETPWYCPHCDVSVTSDLAYIEHINGRRHVHKLGFSMKVMISS